MTQRPTSSNDQFSASTGASGYDLNTGASDTQPLSTASGSTGQSPTAQALRAADQVTDQAKQQASQLADQAKQQVSSQLSSQKTRAAEGLGSVAQALRQTSQQLRDQDQGPMPQYVERAADQIERISGYLQDKDVSQLVDDVERYARRQPALFLGGAFVLGLIGARFLKSSSQSSAGSYGSDTYRTRQYTSGYPDTTTAYGQGYAGTTGASNYGGPADYGATRTGATGYGSTAASGYGTTGSTAGYGATASSDYSTTGATGYGTTGGTTGGAGYGTTGGASSSSGLGTIDDTSASSARERGGTEEL